MDTPFRSPAPYVHPRWEYRKVILDWAVIRDWETMLNDLGRDGWELATSIVPPPTMQGGWTSAALPIVVLLKRSVPG